MTWLRWLFICWWGGCGGTIDYDRELKRPAWTCKHCGKKD